VNIALLHYTSPPIVGGVESVMAHHARLMTEAGHSVTILAGRGEMFDDRIRVRILPRLDSRHAEVLKVKKMLDKGRLTDDYENLADQIQNDLLTEVQGYDLLVAHNVASLNKNLPLTAAMYALYRTPGFPALILWHHDLTWARPSYRSEMHPGYPWDLLRADWDGASQVVVSEQRRQELGNLTGITKEAIHVIPNGVDPGTFYKLEPQTLQLVDQLNLIDADPLFLLPVRLTPRKNIELALRILAELRAEFSKAALLVTGPEGPHNPANVLYKQKLLDLRSEIHLQEAAFFLAELTPGFLPDAVIADFYRIADALLFPSREEGFGIPILEAAFSGMPVFCADIPVFHELGGDDVSYFNPDDDPRSIAAAISYRMKSEATLRWRLRAKRRYTWKSIYKLYIEPLIREVVQ
jgi:glycosyltransferase involved in cell wall biosynthesis